MTSEIDVRPLIDDALDEAARRRASDLHLEPVPGGYEVRYRVDGLLTTAARHPVEPGRGAVLRLMVMAQLLTYRLDIPQEGRLSATPASLGRAIELRLSIMPTIHGLRVVRMPAELVQPRALEDLGLPQTVLRGLRKFAASSSGMLLLTGPAGAGKTTTIYALLAHIAQTFPGLSIVALEDPVERAIPGVTQIQVQPFGELTYERALRSIVRQDPQVLMLGEIRDAATASVAIQAALSGHRLISTLHAGDAGAAIARMLEMGLEPFQVAGALFGVAAQRLLRRKDAADTSGYRGRVPVAELATVDPELRAAILRRADATALMRVLSAQPGYISMAISASDLVAGGVTDAAEVQHVLGV